LITSPHLLSTFIIAAHWLIIVLLSLRVILRRLPVGISLAWLAVVFSVPFVGATAYLIFGEKRLGKGRRDQELSAIKEAQKAIGVLVDSTEMASPPAGSCGDPIFNHVRRVLELPALLHNRLKLLNDFQSIFDSIIADINTAQESCRLGFYIWHEGGRVSDVIDALIQAKRRGVTCLLMADAFGSKAFLKGKEAARLHEAGVEIVIALPPTIGRRRDLRNHRKIIVIDNRIGYTGSQNMVDPRFFKQKSGVGSWVDALVRIEGPAVTMLSNVFQVDWCVESGIPFEQPGRSIKGGEQYNSDAESLLQVVPSGPVYQPQAIYQLILTAIYSARHELILTTPYFVPDESVTTALLSAALRGVDITIIAPAYNDSFLVRHASAALFDRLMEAGVRIALFEGGLLHTKSMVIDGEVSLFGSVNLDMRSMWLNFEISLFIYGAEFATRLKGLQESFLAQSTIADIEVWRNRPAYNRLIDDTIRLFGPLL